MRLVKGVVFIFLVGMLGSCFSPPEFPITPQIEFKDVAFKKVANSSDSIILVITFRDGDGDLGLNADDPKYSSYPYHPINYYLAKGGDTMRVSTEKVYDDVPPIIRIEPGQSGKLATVRTADEPGYEKLPDYNCYNYNFDSVYVAEKDKSIFDNSYNLYKTKTSSKRPTVYHLLDTFLISPNTNHHNITVLFEVKNTNGTYTKIDWRKDYCSEGYDGRFPELSESKVPLDGTLRYAILGRFKDGGFNGKTLRLKVQIKDRALHVSNSVYTKDFIIN